LAEDCAICCAAYLHDIGLAFNPNEWESLRISREYVLRDVNNNKFRKYVRQSEFFKNNILSPSPELDILNLSDEKRFKLVKAIRNLHPWISARLTELKLIDHVNIRPPDSLVSLLSDLCRLHSSKTSLQNYTRRKVEVWGDELNIGLLAAALRLGDALDCTADRAGKAVYKAYVNDMVKFDCSQLKHWVFKQYIDAVKIKEEGDIVVEMNTSKPHAVLGVALFELCHNIWEDYCAADEVFEEVKGVKLRLFLKVPGRGIAQLTEKERKVAGELCEEEDTSSRVAFTKSLEYVGEDAKNYFKNCDGKLECFGGSHLNAFDVLAHLCSPQGEPWGDPEGLVYWLDDKLGLFSKLSPELRALL